MSKKTINNFPKSIRLDEDTQQLIIDMTPPTYSWSESIKLITHYAKDYFEMTDHIYKNKMRLLQFKAEKQNDKKVK